MSSELCDRLKSTRWSLYCRAGSGKRAVDSDQSLRELDNTNSMDKERPGVSVSNETLQDNWTQFIKLWHFLPWQLQYLRVLANRWYLILIRVLTESIWWWQRLATEDSDCELIKQENVSPSLRESLQHHTCSGKTNHYDQRSRNQRLSLLQMESRVAISSSNLRVPSSACSWWHFRSDTTCRRVDVLMNSRVFCNARALLPTCVSSARQRLGCSTDVTHGWRFWRAVSGLSIATLNRPTWRFSELGCVILQLQRGHCCRRCLVGSQDSATGSNSEQVSAKSASRCFCYLTCAR